MKLLDLFCCAGGAAMGYYRAGFDDITGIDIVPQKHYPFKFIQVDALEYLAEHGHEYDAIHASPLCQGYSITKSMPNVPEYARLIPQVRELIIKTKKPYIIENVTGAKDEMINPSMLCGTMFDLLVLRHRLFETNFFILAQKDSHKNVKVYTNANRGYSAFRKGATHICVAGNNFDPKDGAIAMGINWMTRPELAEAIPPAYTEFIGRQLLAQLNQ